MNITKTPIDGVYVVETTPFSDQRGSFARLFCTDELALILGNRKIQQINHSYTATAGTVRGMHLQNKPYAEMKLVRCIKGKIWDVAVDLRKDSPTYKQWHGAELSPENKLMLVIPEGCAHGFQAIEDNTEILYLHTEMYNKSHETGINPVDPTASIKWPMKVCNLSERDKNLPFIKTTIPDGKYNEM